MCKNGLPYLEGDAKGVMEGVLLKKKNNSQYGHVLEDIQKGVQIFSEWKMGHIRREWNGAAHKLAQLAISSSSVDSVWREDFPARISSIVLWELPSLGSLSSSDYLQ